MTRYGKLTTTDDNLLTLDGKEVSPTVQGNSGLSFVKIFRTHQSDVALVEDEGGTACPARFYFVTVNATGATSSPEFGTCNDIIKVRQDGDAILVTMGGFKGPFEPPAEQAKAAREKHAFSFVDSQLLADGKAVNPAVAQPTHDPVAPVPDPAAGRDVHLDPPLREQTITVAASDGHEASKVRCVFYKEFMIRETHLDDNIGTDSISVVPSIASEPDECGAARPARAKDLKDYGGMEFKAAAGRFLLLIWPDGANGATAFSIFDATTTRKLYNDVVKDGADGFSSFVPLPGAEILKISFERVVDGLCSLAGVDASCWGRFVKQAKLPGEIARRSPPVAACAEAYARQKMSGSDLNDPSVVSYKVVMTVATTGASNVISRGELSCWPAG